VRRGLYPVKDTDMFFDGEVIPENVLEPASQPTGLENFENGVKIR
jgi:hypothetical protein